MYNVKVKTYLDTVQIQVFSEPLLSTGSEREDRRKVIYETGEIVPSNRSKIYNAFDEEYVSGRYMHDDEEESLKVSYRRTKRILFDMLKCNRWEWFFTLTFNPEVVDSFDYAETTKKLSKWLNNMRRNCPEMKYVVVPEQHPTSGRWHFHGLFANVENMVFVDSGLRDKKGRVIYNVGKYRLGFSTATKISDVLKSISYITKYVTKELCEVTYGKKRYWHSRNVAMPDVHELLIDDKTLLQELCEQEKIYKNEVEGYYNVIYYEIPIYTTNTMRFITNEISQYSPLLNEKYCEMSEDNK